MLPENLSEKSTISIRVVDMPYIPEQEYFVRISRFQKEVYLIILVSFVVFVISIIL